MTATNPTILALDFDGVICDGLIEYFEVAWKTYCQVWSSNYDNQPDGNQCYEGPPDGLAEKFYPLRPVIETGWEMPVLIKALLDGFTQASILQSWITIAEEILQKSNLNSKDIGSKLDKNRDEWINDDLDGWLNLHRFYPGVVEKIKATLKSNTELYIITTKEARFVQQLLKLAGVEIPASRIFGKDVKLPKYEILRSLKAEYIEESTSKNVTKNITKNLTILFVEDRLKTLELVQKQPDLGDVKLFLADWGYNTQSERENAQNNPNIELISLTQFSYL
jgi:phosphoglycolate phosphatase-like HAD superfamily hydrolase